MDHKDGAPTGEGGNMDYKDGTTTGGEKIWIIRMAPRMEGWEYGFGVWSPVGKIKREKFK